MDINKLVYSECQHPVKVKIYNGIINAYEYKDVPCGKCYHCKITRINEWVTRMVIQSNYSKYVYFGTLTYSSLRPTLYTYECYPFKSNFNRYNRWCDTPTILRKDHVQKFLKRLRKNTGVKFQYAYCGEYGSTYSRPHYHYIIWSNEEIKQSDIYKAWRAPLVNNPKRTGIIGRVDHVDIKNNPRKVTKNGDIDSVYKYVCKYVQKSDFNFNELKNIKQHEKVYHYWFEKDALLCVKHDEYIKKFEVKNFYDYQKMARPFFHCSKKPALGYQYFTEQVGEFSKGNFKLFGLSGDYIFPLYFIRKTKERICPLKAQSETNANTTSYSRLPKMASLLQYIEDYRKIAEDTEQSVQLFRRTDNYYTLESFERIHDLYGLKQLYAKEDEQLNRVYLYKFHKEYLGFTNHETKVMYIFCHQEYTNSKYAVPYNDFYEMYSTTTKEFLGIETIENVINLINYYYGELKRKILLDLYAKSKVSANQKAALIEDIGGIDKFNAMKEKCIESLNNRVRFRQNLYKQTKTLE